MKTFMKISVMDVGDTHRGNPDCKMRIAQGVNGWYCVDCGLYIIFHSIVVEEIDEKDSEGD